MQMKQRSQTMAQFFQKVKASLDELKIRGRGMDKMFARMLILQGVRSEVMNEALKDTDSVHELAWTALERG